MKKNINSVVDVKEDDVARILKGKVLEMLLVDQTKTKLLRSQPGHEKEYAYIIWATEDYASEGEGYHFNDEIKSKLITGTHSSIIMPRVLKDKMQQVVRSKDRAEVFTPSWVCNAQNNLIDEAWFGHKDVFNIETVTEDGVHSWTPTLDSISFEGTGKTWMQYVRDTRMEITCGEAPYLVSRYDATTGDEIPLERRVGLLDRKLRVINENVKSLSEWKKWALIAYHNIYGFEWQGDNLLLAREALLCTLLDYYEDIQKRLGTKNESLSSNTLLSFANIISWNIWQMDGIKMVIPNSCHDYEEVTKIPATLFEAAYEVKKTCQCPGCVSGDNTKHNGIYPLIRDWGVYDNDHKDKNGKTGKERCDIRFVDVVNHKTK